MRTANRSAADVLIAAVVLTLLLAAKAVECQVADNRQASTIQSAVLGVVRDATGHPLSGAIISLQNGKQTVTAVTDASGAYRFSNLQAGSYTLSAKLPEFSDTKLIVEIKGGESKVADLIFSPKGNHREERLGAGVEFFDEPHFEVAGVADTTNLGGHGSSVALARNRDSIEKAVASLKSERETQAAAGPADQAREANLRQELKRQPQSSEVNVEFGKLLLDEGRANEALEYLDRACRLNPSQSQNWFELAKAHVAAGDYTIARDELLSHFVSRQDDRAQPAEMRHLLAQIDEKMGEPAEAVRQFQGAAELNASETNLFDWGSELLLHHAPEPAMEVFQKGTRLFPKSIRMLVALGASWYALGFFDKAAESLCAASDLNPNDPEPYLLMGTVQASEAMPSAAISERLRRFLKLQPANAMANYYYAVSLWKDAHSGNGAQDFSQAKSLLLTAIELEPSLAPAYVQLGMIFAEEKKLPAAISAYQRATAIDPDFEDAHYRMAQAYRQLGEASKAQSEVQAYERVKQNNAEKIAREGQKNQQFVYQIQKQ